MSKIRRPFCERRMSGFLLIFGIMTSASILYVLSFEDADLRQRLEIMLTLLQGPLRWEDVPSRYAKPEAWMLPLGMLAGFGIYGIWANGFTFVIALFSGVAWWLMGWWGIVSGV